MNGVTFQLANRRYDETEAHTTKTLQYRQYDDPPDVTFALDAEDDDHENQD